MPSQKRLSFALSLFFLIAVSATGTPAATVTIKVSPGNVTCTTTSDPPCYPSIQGAIDNASLLASANTGTTYQVLVEPGTYTGGIVLKPGISVQGRETARTIITMGGSGTAGTAVTAIAVTGTVTFSNFTIIGATTGIDVSGGSTLKINNNVFNLGLNGTAVRIQASPSAQVINNTFYQNGIALVRDSDMTVVNNIFSQNSTDISQSITGVAGIDYNLFDPAPLPTEPIGSNALPNTIVTNPSPLFVNPSARDFHLKENSPAQDRGSNINGSDIIDSTTSDLGAYGGPNSDTLPFPVQNVQASKSGADSVSVSWSQNESYLVSRSTDSSGGYNVYYRLGKSGDLTKVTLASAATGTVISGLTTTVAQPDAPVLNEPLFSNRTLEVSWSSVPTATKYFVHYRDLDISSSPTITIGVSGNAVELGDLENGHHYEITVSAIAEPIYYFSVTAFDSTVTSGAGNPGVAHESTYSVEREVAVGTPSESPLSTPVVAFPEAIIPNPDLPNNGCFIATAAYGYYSAPQVQTLRVFRDQYLLTNPIGRKFVHWYYRYGPVGAAFIQAHPGLKPLVRVGLAPAVGAALFMTKTSYLTKCFTGLLILFALSYIIYRRNSSMRSGGVE